tara:strand:+ start:45 stop:467 length:423 start_codon:yes stop_codon:yes gene_type:complete
MPLSDPVKRKQYNSIWRWKNWGIICDDFDKLYDKYINTTHCEICKVELCEGNHGSNKKAIDHDHITGKVRYICCHSCNMNTIKMTHKNNVLGEKNITLTKKGQFVFRKQVKGKKICKYFNNINDAIEFREKASVNILTDC